MTATTFIYASTSGLRRTGLFCCRQFPIISFREAECGSFLELGEDELLEYFLALSNKVALLSFEDPQRNTSTMLGICSFLVGKPKLWWRRQRTSSKFPSNFLLLRLGLASNSSNTTPYLDLTGPS